MKKAVFSRVSFLSILLCLGALFGASTSSAQTIYLTAYNHSFGSFNLSTFQYSQISASLGTGVVTYNLTPDGAGGFFGTQNPGTSNNPSDTFVKITTAGAVTQVGAVGVQVGGLNRATNGTLYANDDFNPTFGTINPTTGAYTSLGNSGHIGNSNGGADLAFVGLTLYADSSDNGGSLYTVNTTTGAYSAQIGASNNLYTNGSLFSVGNNLYLLYGDNVYTANTTTGALTQIGTLTGANLPTQFIGASLVPEPSTWVLLGAGIVGLGVMTLRRRVVRV